jgi:hypothetical protein
MGHAAVCEALGAPPPVVPAPEGKTLLLLPKSCEDHKTASSLARDAEDVPPENVDRLRVLTDSQTGILQLGEFAHRTVQEDCERPAAMVDVLRVHEYTYIKKIQARPAGWLCAGAADGRSLGGCLGPPPLRPV